MYIKDSSPTVSRCVFFANVAGNGGVCTTGTATQWLSIAGSSQTLQRVRVLRVDLAEVEWSL